MANDSDFPEELLEYRQFLVSAEKEAQHDYDKNVLTLSGGGIGISFAFLDKIAGAAPSHMPYLIAAWLCWGFSVTAVLGSFLFSQLAMRAAIRQVDEGKIRGVKPGGRWSSLTTFLNAVGGTLFLLGLLSISAFACVNIGEP